MVLLSYKLRRTGHMLCRWFSANGTNAKYPEHFGGGIISLKLVYPQLVKRGLVGLGLRMMLQTDTPSPGYWVRVHSPLTTISHDNHADIMDIAGNGRRNDTLGIVFSDLDRRRR